MWFVDFGIWPDLSTVWNVVEISSGTCVWLLFAREKNGMKKFPFALHLFYCHLGETREKCKWFKCRAQTADTDRKQNLTRSSRSFASVIMVTLQSSCRLYMLLMLRLRCICTGTGTSPRYRTLLLLSRKGNISVIYNSDRRCLICYKPLFSFSLWMLFSTVTKTCFECSCKTSSPVSWKVVIYMQTLNVLLNALFFCFFLCAPRALSKSSAWSSGRTFVQD